MSTQVKWSQFVHSWRSAHFFSKVTCFHKEENDENENKMTFDALLFEREELFAEIERVKQMESELERLEEK